MKKPDYPTIAVSELSRFRLDKASARAFERRWWPAMVGVIVLVFVVPLIAAELTSFSWMPGGFLAALAGASALVGVAVGLRSWRQMIWSIPQSVETGNEMKPFVIVDPGCASHSYEIAYIDEAYGTYFRRDYIS